MFVINILYLCTPKNNIMKASFGNIAVLILLFIGGMALASLKPFGWLNVLGIIGGSAAMIAAVILDYKSRWKK